MKRVPILLLLCFVCPGLIVAAEGGQKAGAAATGITVEGRVVEDANGNGRLDAGEKPLPGVVVSDGLQAARTDAQGRYVLTGVNPTDRRFVFTVTPSGYRHSDQFYRPLPIPGQADPKSGGGEGHALEPSPAQDREGKRYTNFNFALVPDPQSAKTDFSFFQVTDTHVVFPGNVSEFLDLVKHLRTLNQAFIINTGDLVDDGRSALQVDNYAKVLRLSSLPIFSLPGNHDIGEPAKSRYKDTVGPDRYSFDYGGRHFLMLNSILDVEKQYEWMKRDLALQPAGKELLVFQHYPPDRRLMDFLAGYNTRAVFSGHLHASRVFMYGKTLYVNTPAMRFGSIDFSPRVTRRVSFRAGQIVLDDVFPHEGVREVWAAGVDRPLPDAEAPEVAPGEDWPMLQHDAARTGVTADQVKPPLKLAWRRTLAGTIHGSSPVVAGKTVYIGLADEENRGRAGVCALDAGTGQEQWRYTTSSSVRGTLAVASGLVYGVTIEGEVFALDAGTGDQKWRYDLGKTLEQSASISPVVSEGVVYVGMAPAFVALDGQTGKPKWRAEPMGGGWGCCLGSPAMGEGLVFAGFTWNKGLYAMDARTGEKRWSNETFVDLNVPPTFAGGMLYAISAGWNGGLYALDPETGLQKWKFTAGAGKIGFASPALAGRTLLLGGIDGQIFGVDIANGKPRWIYQKKDVSVRFSFAPYSRNRLTFTSPAVSGSVAYVGNTAGQFIALDTSDGKELWSCDLGAPIVSSAAVSGNAVFTATYDGTVYAFVAGKAAKPIDARQFTWRPCDLRGLLNRPLADDVDSDGKGGWTDQGPEADLRNLAAGDHTFNDVAFRVASGNACFITRSRYRPSGQLPESGKVSLGGKADVLAFQHSGGWLMPGLQHATYVLTYADGQKAAIPVISGRNISDWNLPSSDLWGLEYDPALGFTEVAASVSVPSFGLASVWMTLWKNPRPDQEIIEFEVKGENEGIAGLIAVSLGTKK